LLTGAVALFLCLAAWPALPAEPKPWDKLTDCQCVANAENDGDNFRVPSGEKEFLVRLCSEREMSILSPELRRNCAGIAPDGRSWHGPPTLLLPGITWR
jgi:hypothetical protein